MSLSLRNSREVNMAEQGVQEGQGKETRVGR